MDSIPSWPNLGNPCNCLRRVLEEKSGVLYVGMAKARVAKYLSRLFIKFIKAVSDTVLVMVDIVYHDKPLIFIGLYA